MDLIGLVHVQVKVCTEGKQSIVIQADYTTLVSSGLRYK